MGDQHTPDAACIICQLEARGRPARVLAAECGRMAGDLMLFPGPDAAILNRADAGAFAEASAHFARMSSK